MHGNKNHTAFSVADMEQNISNVTRGKNEIEKENTLACIHIHSIRHRLADADGISAKAALDALVIAGVLPDDSPKYVKWVTYSQEKISKKEDEETIITIEEA